MVKNKQDDRNIGKIIQLTMDGNGRWILALNDKGEIFVFIIEIYRNPDGTVTYLPRNLQKIMDMETFV